MPFAKKWAAMMGFPLPGEALGGFTVESIEVRDVSGEFGQHGYAVDMVLRGSGGQTALQKALRPLLGTRPVTFSAYGNPYQLWAGKPAVEALGDQRYAVSARGAGVPIALDAILHRFLDALAEDGALADAPEAADRETLISAYLDAYRDTIERDVNRYRGRLRRLTQ
ncbi:MAG: hypothetical protein MUF84_08730 [Anaerolineae bacterium]|jgi:hypothetical protein|nr:hypothetical protein [Anaerolineae bacterium]